MPKGGIVLKEIIKDGFTKFYADCPTCGCTFSYELSDVQEYDPVSVYPLVVECPKCGRLIEHPDQSESDYPPQGNSFILKR